MYNNNSIQIFFEVSEKNIIFVFKIIKDYGTRH